MLRNPIFFLFLGRGPDPMSPPLAPHMACSGDEDECLIPFIAAVSSEEDCDDDTNSDSEQAVEP